jgi:hypothetical protein
MLPENLVLEAGIQRTAAGPGVKVLKEKLLQRRSGNNQRGPRTRMAYLLLKSRS